MLYQSIQNLAETMRVGDKKQTVIRSNISLGYPRAELVELLRQVLFGECGVAGVCRDPLTPSSLVPRLALTHPPQNMAKKKNKQVKRNSFYHLNTLLTFDRSSGPGVGTVSENLKMKKVQNHDW